MGTLACRMEGRPKLKARWQHRINPAAQILLHKLRPWMLRAMMRRVQFWQTENNRRLDCACRGRYRRTIPNRVDATCFCPVIPLP